MWGKSVCVCVGGGGGGGGGACVYVCVGGGGGCMCVCVYVSVHNSNAFPMRGGGMSERNALSEYHTTNTDLECQQLEKQQQC